MAVEDAMCISEVLGSGATAADVPQRLELYESIRKERAEWARDQARINAMNEDVRPPSKYCNVKQKGARSKLLTRSLSQGWLRDAEGLS